MPTARTKANRKYNEKAYDRLAITIPKGKITLIKGRSGCGKSTIAKLILRERVPAEGKICYAGVDISLFNLHKWRGMIGYVPQESSLLNVSILENIALQKEGANMERVLEICKMLNISEMIQRSPLGLLTPAGQEGNGLSGGECQKIAVARALYKDAQIYIFDEATSSLDPASEQCVLDVMVHLREKGKTVIFISHKETGESCGYSSRGCAPGRGWSGRRPQCRSGSASYARRKRSC